MARAGPNTMKMSSLFKYSVVTEIVKFEFLCSIRHLPVAQIMIVYIY